MKEFWTIQARRTFKENIIYLQKSWTDREIDKFVERTFEAIDLILNNPNIGKYDESWGANKFLIVPQIYLFYKVDEKRELIALLYFWNNYQMPI